MSIIHMASSEAEARERGVNVRKYASPYADENTKNIWLYDTHVGLCLSDREHNGYDDSDWYMLVWDPEKGEPHEIEFASTRGWSYPCYGSSPDATPEVRAAYEAWRERKRAEALKLAEEKEAREPRKGKTVKVVRGRKVPRGTVGECFWRGPGKAYSYSQARWGVPDRIGFRTADGITYWTSVENVEVVNNMEVAA